MKCTWKKCQDGDIIFPVNAMAPEGKKQLYIVSKLALTGTARLSHSLIIILEVNLPMNKPVESSHLLLCYKCDTHRDLNAGNVLLTSSWAEVDNLGLSRVIEEHHHFQRDLTRAPAQQVTIISYSS